MRLVAVVVAFAAVVGFTLWQNTRTDSEYIPPSPAPTLVNCGDAAELGETALEGRRQRDETSSDQEKVVASNRATYFASLAIIADLKCKVTLPDADEALK